MVSVFRGSEAVLCSGIFDERCHNQFSEICADIKEVKTTNSKRSADQEDSCHTPA
jgi:hypothetical protein